MGNPFVSLAGRLAANLGEERERWPLWAPVVLGVGVALYFEGPGQPDDVVAAAPLILAGIALVVLRQRACAGWLFLGALAAAGFLLAHAHTRWADAPVLERPIGPVPVVGTIADASWLGNGWRIVLADVTIARLEAPRTPRKVRLTLRGVGVGAIAVGDGIRVLAQLEPPSPPVLPGGFDFARSAYFAGIGAVGYGVAAPEFRPRPRGGIGQAVNGLRQDIAERVRSVLPAEAAALVVALLVGDRSAMAQDDLDAMRDSGLAHLLAISGLHLGLVAGLFLVAVRGAIAFVPWLAVRVPAKKIAAAVALAAAGVYLLLAGASVPTQRSFAMLALVLLAVLVDRRGLSMRMVAWAAVAVLAISPVSLLGPSFQMSFAAVVALIAAYEALSPAGATGPPTLVARLRRYLFGLIVTSLVAGAATTPFAVFHFNRLAVFGIAANLLAVPVTAFWIMPWGVIALVLLPLGLERVALVPMAWGTDAVLWVGHWVASWPSAAVVLPAMPTWGLACTSLGGLWLCLWQRRWRLAGAPAVVAGLAGIAAMAPPDLLVDREGRLVAVHGQEEGVVLSARRTDGFVAGEWLAHLGREPVDARAMSCDRGGCIGRVRGRLLAFSRDAGALAEDCRVAAVVVTALRVRGGCRGAELVIDGAALRAGGAHAVWLGPGGYRVVTARDRRGEWPWSRAPVRRVSGSGGSGRRGGPAP